MNGSGAGAVARHFPLDAELRRRVEPVAPRKAPPRRVPVTRKPVSRASALRGLLEQNLLLLSSVLLLVAVAGWGLALYGEFRASGLIGSNSIYAETARPDIVGRQKRSVRDVDLCAERAGAAAGCRRPRGPRVGLEHHCAGLELFRTQANRRRAAPTGNAGQDSRRRRCAAPAPAPVRTASIDPVHTASIEKPAPQMMLASAPDPVPAAPHVPLGNIEAKTSLVDFETAPFPYRGMVPGSNRQFLDAGQPGQRGHVNFRGRMFLESKTFGDDRVLLHIPQGFDPNRPAVMVVFFHGHGATLERDVRDRQRLPDQISAAGLNAVLVAPQFAFDAADFSAGKFWEPDGFKHFLDETAKKLAALYGDQRSGAAFANMPIVLVSYSGGFGPTLSVLARGGAQSRIRGLVLLDSLYAGIDQFADWIADNRSTFFVSSYTPHTAHHNADLEHALAERSVPYSSELRRNHLQGMVTFLPAGDVSHRDFVTHAWTDNPVQDILLRMTDVVPKTDAATVTAKRN